MVLAIPLWFFCFFLVFSRISLLLWDEGGLGPYGHRDTARQPGSQRETIGDVSFVLHRISFVFHRVSYAFWEQRAYRVQTICVYTLTDTVSIGNSPDRDRRAPIYIYTRIFVAALRAAPRFFLDCDPYRDCGRCCRGLMKSAVGDVETTMSSWLRLRWCSSSQRCVLEGGICM